MGLEPTRGNESRAQWPRNGERRYLYKKSKLTIFSPPDFQESRRARNLAVP